MGFKPAYNKIVYASSLPTVAPRPPQNPSRRSSAFVGFCSSKVCPPCKRFAFAYPGGQTFVYNQYVKRNFLKIGSKKLKKKTQSIYYNESYF
jgi:hypothetical protein